MPNTSGTGICDEDHTQSHGCGDSIEFGRITPTLSDWLNELLRSERHLVAGVHVSTDRTLVIRPTMAQNRQRSVVLVRKNP